MLDSSGVGTALCSSATPQGSNLTQYSSFSVIHPILAVSSLIGTCGFAELAAHVSCGCVNHAVAVTWNLPGFAYLTQLLLFELLPPVQVYSSVRLFYYRVIQEKLNLPFPFFVNEAGSSET